MMTLAIITNIITVLIITVITIISRSNQRLGSAIEIHAKGETNGRAITNALT